MNSDPAFLSNNDVAVPSGLEQKNLQNFVLAFDAKFKIYNILRHHCRRNLKEKIAAFCPAIKLSKYYLNIIFDILNFL